ncbi:MAG: heme-binding protein [Sphingomonadaceae bacterium]|nr:heme-binding protein [Sphingomonadaceae bacterium]
MSKARWIAAAAAGTAAVAAAAYYLNERNTEKPDYDLLIDEGKFALRAYPEMVVAETVQAGSRETAMGNGFRVLADYIFARSRPGEKIAMTAPILCDADPDSDEDSWRTRFVMPGKYREDDLPPESPGMIVTKMPARRVAVFRFSGAPDDDVLAAKKAELAEWMEANSLEAEGPAEFAFYNSPFIPGPIRRNEIWIPVA